MTISPESLQLNLQGFIGSEQFFRSQFGRLIYTEGVQYLAEKAQAFWLIDAIASHQSKVKNYGDAQFWTIRKAPTPKYPNGFWLECKVNDKIIVKQRIPFSDFPLNQFDLIVRKGGYYDENDNVITSWTLMLPTED